MDPLAFFSRDGGSTWSGADVLPDGVHFDLAPEVYFDQVALGSTDLIKLWQQREGFWWSSRWNPRYKRPKNPFQTYGSGAHAIILEGTDAYDERFVAAPDYDDLPGLFDTTQQAVAWLAKNGFKTTGRPYSDWRKDDWLTAVVDGEIDIPWKSAIARRFELSVGDREIVSAADDESIRFLRQVMLDPGRDDNADIRQLFAEGGDFPPMAEVSILHTMEDGVRRRWRIDRMFPKFDLDLKTLGNWTGRPLEFETGEVIAKRGMDLQRADYKIGRQVAYEYVRAGRVYGGSLEQREWIRSWPDDFPTWDWKWLFYQKPDSVTGRAPVLFPIHDDDESVHEINGRAKARNALQFFRAAVRRYGLTTPWARVAPQHFLDEAYKPNPLVHLPHWISTPDAPDDADAWDHRPEED